MCHVTHKFVEFEGDRIMTYLKKGLITFSCYMAIGLALITVIVFLVIGNKTMVANEKKEMDKIEKTSKLHTSKVVAYEFKPNNRNAVKLEDGTQFEEETITIKGRSNFKSKVKFNSETVKDLPEVTYAKKKQDSKEMYYIFKVE